MDDELSEFELTEEDFDARLEAAEAVELVPGLTNQVVTLTRLGDALKVLSPGREVDVSIHDNHLAGVGLGRPAAAR